MTARQCFNSPYMVAAFAAFLFYLALVFSGVNSSDTPTDTEQKLMQQIAVQQAQIATIQQQLSDMEFTIDRRFGLLRDQAFIDRLEQGQGPAIIAKQLKLLADERYALPRIASR